MKRDKDWRDFPEPIQEENKQITEIDSELLDQNDSILDCSQQEEVIVSVKNHDSPPNNNNTGQSYNILPEESESEIEFIVNQTEEIQGTEEIKEDNKIEDKPKEDETQEEVINNYLLQKASFNETQSVQENNKDILEAEEGLKEEIDNGPSTARKGPETEKIQNISKLSWLNSIESNIPVSSSFTKQSRHTSELDTSGVTEVEILLESHNDFLQYMHLLAQINEESLNG